MPSSRRLLNSLVLLANLLLLPAIASAREPHTWCITGAPLVPGGSTDATANQVIGKVCGSAGSASCCAAGGRWGLSCVQLAADFAWQSKLSGGDFCGRYGWSVGPVGTEQYYPRDFNLFVTAGNLSGIRDVDGSVAASGNVSASSFNLNVRPRETTALFAGGSVNIWNGSINGNVIYGGGYNDPRVNYGTGARPSARTSPFPIDFQNASAGLIAMSQQVFLYDSISAVRVNQTITFVGTDPELNVFNLNASSMTGATSYVYNVPAASTVIVNVGGSSPVITNAEFSGSISANRVLWNFAEATTLVTSSVSFPGSILAPKAAANMRNGQLFGTLVVASGQPVDIELYAAPFQVPSCGGSLCLDPTWSTAAETLVDDQANAALIAPEAGFLEIAGGKYIAEGMPRTSPTHRMWYAFQPSPSMPKKKPLAVFFNGGPGAATSSMLFSFNTATATLDPQRTPPGATVIANSTPWTQFANLLYIDAPATGFSYPVANADGTKPDIGIDEDSDAGIFTRVILRFLKRHPSLINNRVIIVGESYGGERATLMLQNLYNSASLTNPSALFQDSRLSDEQSGYFKFLFGTPTPVIGQIAAKFGHQALIEPVVAGQDQIDGHSKGSVDAFPLTNCRTPTCMTATLTDPSTCDPYNCDKPAHWSDNLETTAGTRLTDVSTLNVALGVNPRTIEWMMARSRTKAYGRSDGDIIANPTSMINAFGTLGPDDNYFMTMNAAVLDGYAGGTARKWSSPGAGLTSATDYVTQLRNGVSTFVTVTNFDTVVYSPDIPYAIAFFERNATFKSLVSGVSYSKTDNTGLARPGDSFVTYASDNTTRRVVMPFSYVAGHTVSMRAPAELLADVMLWYNNSLH